MTTEGWRAIPWLRLLAESAAIVGSILLAFAIDRLWDAHRETRREMSFVRALTVEFEAAKAELRADAQWRLEIERVGRQLLLGGRGRVLPPDDSIAAWIREFSRMRIFAPPMGAFDDLLNSGGLSSLQSDSLRLALLEYDQERRRLRLMEDREASSWEDHLRPYLAEHTAALLSTAPGRTIPTTHPTGYSTALRDRTFESHVANRLHRLTATRTWSDSTMRVIDHVLKSLRGAH
jgi:hypothetical protein